MFHATLLLTLSLFAGGDEGVSFYQLADFRGEYTTYTASRLELDLSGETGSLFVPPGYKVELFAEPRFKGRRFVTRSSIPDLALTPFAEQSPASMRLTWLGADWPDLPEDTTEGVTLFTGRSFSGDYQVYQDDVARLDQSQLGDQSIASALVAPGYQAILYTGRKYHGTRTLLQAGRHELPTNGWNSGHYYSLRVLPDSVKVDLEPQVPVGPVPVCDVPFHIGGEVHIELDGDAGKVLTVAAGALLVAAAVKGIKEHRARTAIDRGVVLFNQTNFNGAQVLVLKNARNLEHRKIGMPNPASLIVPPGYEVVAYAEPDFRGASVVLTGKIERVDQPIRSLQLRKRN